jgi:hypothetical protein
MQAPHNHHDQGLQKEPIGIDAGTTASPLERCGHRDAIHQFDQGDKQSILQ